MNNEPIAWKTTKGALAFCDAKYGEEQGWTPLYACKNPIRELTDEQIEDVQKQFYQLVTNHDKDFARAILRKANEK